MECGIVVMLTYMWIIISSMVMMLMKLRKLRIFKASSEVNDPKDIKYFLLIEICKFNDWLKKVYSGLVIRFMEEWTNPAKLLLMTATRPYLRGIRLWKLSSIKDLLGS